MSQLSCFLNVLFYWVEVRQILYSWSPGIKSFSLVHLLLLNFLLVLLVFFVIALVVETHDFASLQLFNIFIAFLLLLLVMACCFEHLVLVFVVFPIVILVDCVFEKF